MVITLFGAIVVNPGKEDAEAKIAEHLCPIVHAPGFISMKSCLADDGEELGVIRFDSRETLDRWMTEGVHAAAQTLGPEIYKGFWVQTAETYREYKWEGETKTEGDLTELFSEKAAAAHAGARAQL